MKRVFILSALIAVVLISCTEETIFDRSRDGIVSVIGEIPEMPAYESVVSPETKATLSYVVRYNWSRGDRINVINLTTGKVLGGYLAADEAGNIVTFSGSVKGSVSPSDVLLFVYPYTSNTRERDFTMYQYDFRNQVGTSPETCPFVVSAVSTGFTSNNFHNAYLSFEYQVSFVQLNLAGLPANEYIDYIRLDGIESALRLTIDNGRPVFSTYDVIASSVYGDDEATSVRLNPSSFQTSSQGTSIVFFTCPSQPATLVSKYVEVSTDNVAYGTRFNAFQFLPGTSYRHFLFDFRSLESGE